MNSKHAVDKDSSQIMNLLCSEKAEELNGLLSRIEQSVKTLAVYTLEKLESVTRLKQDTAYMKEYTELLESVAVNAATNTEGAVAVYIRFNPEFAPPTSGIFWSKTNQNGSFQRLTPTDFSRYNPTDVEHVGWYYIPVKKGKATWMSPYLNENINLQMISYVIPLYKDNETVGVVGMDIDLEVMTTEVAGMRVYQTGYAFLTDTNASIVYHRELPFRADMQNMDVSLQYVAYELENRSSGNLLYSYQWKGQEKKMAFRNLINGMCLAVAAPVSEIDAQKNQLIFQIVFSVIGISAVAILFTVIVTRRIIQPLRELNEAAKKIAEGDLSISLTHQTKDEVGTLADSFQQTVSHLQKYIDYINGLAYRDSLTGVKNKTAYQDAVNQIEERMRLGRPEFAVVIFDINGLKKVNDTCGHDFGDMLIQDSCKLICKVFKHSPVYRIGGDEFVTILENWDFDHYNELLNEFEHDMKEQNQNSRFNNKVSIARGIAVYNYETDLVFGNVFKRADEAMYQNKTDMKEQERKEAG